MGDVNVDSAENYSFFTIFRVTANVCNTTEKK